jgi:hypothetical protein
VRALFAWLAFRRLVVARRVVVNLASGQAIEGLLVRQQGPLLLLEQPVVHEPGAAPSPADGQMVIERAQVAFIQIVR